MRYVLSLSLALFLLLVSFRPSFAVYEPSSVPNNTYGIHIVEPNDLPDAARLVNTSGGDWGYVTLVIQQTQRDTAQWQKTFDEMRRLHLIPIVRIASRPVGETWEKPSLGDIDGWVSFLNSLNWVVKNRYVVIANEPNHVNEWGGEVNPEEYARYLWEFSAKLKQASEDFFVMSAGLDASAPNSKTTLDETVFLKRMLVSQSNLFDHLDGWASHSYPNPDFSGPENGYGRGSVRTYEWELSLLKSLGVGKDLPVFITETGWVHETNNLDKIGAKYAFAFTNVWNDKRVAAVTPFLLSYDKAPFDVFSWKAKEGNFYPFYTEVQALPKSRGAPAQDDKAGILSLFVQPFHLTDSSFTGVVLIKNEGQAVWQAGELSLSNNGPAYEISSFSFDSLEPGNTGFLIFKGITPNEGGLHTDSVMINRNGEAISKVSHFGFITVSPSRMKIDTLFATIVRLIKGH